MDDLLDNLEILHVEDNPGDQRLFAEFLKETTIKEYSLTQCDRLQEAVALIENGTFSVIFLDLNLPDSEGLKSLLHIKSKNLSIPVIVLTGLDDETTGVTALRKGAQDYLTKGSIDAALLVRTIRYAIERQKLSNALLDSAREHIKVTGRFRMALEAANEGIWEWNIGSGGTFFSERWREMLGYKTVAEVPDSFAAWQGLIHPDDLGLFLDSWATYMDEESDTLLLEYRMLCKSGEYRWIEVRGGGIRNVNGQIKHMMGSHVDITERKEHQALLIEHKEKLEKLVEERTRELVEANKKLELLSITDPLTGLSNRRYMEDAIQLEWKRLARNDEPLAVLVIDVDFFKSFNDNFGHAEGDKCLQLISNVIKNMARRPGDIAARYGGEEFVLIFPACDQDSAIKLAEEARQAVYDLHIPAACHDVCEWVTASIGIASVITSIEENNWNKLFEIADQSLYASKTNGRNQVTASLN